MIIRLCSIQTHCEVCSSIQCFLDQQRFEISIINYLLCICICGIWEERTTLMNNPSQQMFSYVCWEGHEYRTTKVLFILPLFGNGMSLSKWVMEQRTGRTRGIEIIGPLLAERESIHFLVSASQWLWPLTSISALSHGNHKDLVGTGEMSHNQPHSAFSAHISITLLHVPTKCIIIASLNAPMHNY